VTGLERLNAMDEPAAEADLLACCGSKRWARQMARARPFHTEAELLAAAERAWVALPAMDRLEAFAAHPRIGARTSGQAAREQAGARGAAEEVRLALAVANREYENRFGYIFIVYASGKSAEEMLDLCRQRLHNDPAKEFELASQEQMKIVRLRLREFLGPS
jgi:OHCU decarboxylase